MNLKQEKIGMLPHTARVHVVEGVPNILRCYQKHRTTDAIQNVPIVRQRKQFAVGVAGQFGVEVEGHIVGEGGATVLPNERHGTR